MSIMPTHPHQASVTRILKSSPACQNSHFFNCISALPNISMNAVFFASKIEIWETAFENCSHTYPIDKDMSFIDILTYMWLSLFLFLWLFLPLKFICWGIAQCQVQYDKYFTSFYNQQPVKLQKSMWNELEMFVNFARGYCLIISLSLAHKNITHRMWCK